MQNIPLEIVFEICQYLLVNDRTKYCIFADESSRFRLTCKTYYNYLYPKLPKESLLYGPCMSVAKMCPLFTQSESMSGMHNPSPFLTVVDWTSTARKRCVYHCHCKKKKQFERWEVWMMRTMASSLVDQIKMRTSNYSKFAVLKVPSLAFLHKFNSFLRQCGVHLSNKMTIFVPRRSAGSTEDTVIYRRNTEFYYLRDTAQLLVGT